MKFMVCRLLGGLHWAEMACARCFIAAGPDRAEAVFRNNPLG